MRIGIGRFIVQINSRGLKTEKIQNKLSLMIVENIHLNFSDVFIPEENKLPGVTDFSSVAKVFSAFEDYCGLSDCWFGSWSV